VGNDGGDLCRVVGECACDLRGREDEASRRVEQDLDRAIVGRLLDRAQDALGVVDVDIARKRKAQQRERLLAVDECDHRRAALA